MPDRTKQPAIKEMGTFRLPDYTIEHLDNQIPVILFEAGEQEVSKVDLVFKAGTWHQPKPMVAPSAASLLDSGTSSLTSRDIASQTDYFGAHLFSGTTPDHALATTFSLNKHLEPMTALLSEVVKNAAFPRDEIETHLRNQKHHMLVNEQKVDYLARTRFTNHLFGDNHPYGRYLKEDYFRNVTQETLQNFHKNFYHANNCYIMVSGRAPKDIMKILNTHFGQPDWSGVSKEEKSFQPNTSSPGEYYIEKKDAVQSAIKMGKVLFTRTHPDYQAMKVVNTLFGGYFGSRLMKNIREDKGYTYGIYSGVSSMLHEGYFAITAETGKDVTELAVKEIFSELEKLQTDLVSQDELETVKNYMLGSVLKMVDGAFAAGDFFRTLYDTGLDEQYFYRFIDTIKNITPETIRELSQKYLRKEDFIQIIAG